MDKAVFAVDLRNPGIVDVEMVRIVEGINEITKKCISYEDFLAIVNNSTKADNFLHVGKLPEGYYDAILDKDEMGFKCLVVVPEGLKPIIYYSDIYMVPFPKLMFYFKVRTGILKESKVYALKSGRISDKTTLYKYPFGNVYDGGKICWGGNVINGIYELRKVERIISTFFGSPTNDDLWGKCINVPSDDPRRVQRGLLESLNMEKTFPEDILVKTHYSVKNLLKL